MYHCNHLRVLACSTTGQRCCGRIDLCTVITCECSQKYGMTALLWASACGHAETVRVLVELGASLEAVDKVHIHAHALAYTCCIKHVSGIMRMSLIFFPPSPKSDHLIFPFPNTILLRLYYGSFKAVVRR